MRLLFFYGPPAAGKLTVAREVERRTGLPVFHNHLTIELAATVMPRMTPERSALISKLRLDVIEAAAEAGISLIFTFVYAAGPDDAFVGQIVDAVKGHGGRVGFVQLLAPTETLLDRAGDESRQPFSKFKQRDALAAFLAGRDLQTPYDHPDHLCLDTGKLSVEESAERIISHFGLETET